jgi:4-hydroxy-2-oxoheptanedioate aldolase
MTEFQEQLKAGRPQLGLCSMYPTPGIIERIGADWDWIWVDGQHGQWNYANIIDGVRACDLIGRPAFVRVPGHEFGPIGQVLDTGAQGLIVPCVDTPEQAQNVVDAAKFPPLGKRSYGGRRVIDRRGREYSDNANEDVMLILQIESPEAIENAEAIAAMPGVDALFLGPDDITLRRGYSMTAPRTKEMLGKDMEAVVSACRKHGKFSVIVGIGDMLPLCLEMGYDMIAAGGDVAFLANGSKEFSAAARAVLEEGQQKPASQDSQNVSSAY